MPAPKHRGRKPAPEPEPDDDDLEAIEEDELPWEDELREWADGEALEDAAYKVVLYRLRPKGGGKERVWEWADEIPSAHDIGLAYGGGLYVIYLIIPGNSKRTRKIKHRRFTLADSYTLERDALLRENGLAGGAPVPTGNPLQLGLDMVKQIMEMMTPFLNRAAPAAAGGLEYMKEIPALLSGVLRDSATSQIELARDFSKELAMARGEGSVEVHKDQPEADEFKEFLKDCLKEYGPKLLEATGLKLRMMQSAVKSNEVFQVLTANKPFYETVLSLLMKDPEIQPQKETVIKVLQKLGTLNVGANLPAQSPGTAQNGHKASARPRAAAPRPAG